MWTRRERCLNGHPFTAENTRFARKDGVRYQICKACRKAADRRYYLETYVKTGRFKFNLQSRMHRVDEVLELLV